MNKAQLKDNMEQTINEISFMRWLKEQEAEKDSCNVSPIYDERIRELQKRWNMMRDLLEKEEENDK